MSQQQTVLPATTRSSVEFDGEDREKEVETTNFLFSYVISRSSNDTSLSTEQVQTFQSVNEQVGEREGAAMQVGRRLAELGK